MMDTAFRLCRTGMMTIAWMMVLPCLFILIGAIVPIIPWFRIYAVNVVPNHTSWLFLWAIAALLIGLLANSLHRTQIALGLVATSAGTVLVTAVVMLHLLYVAEINGARINLVRALDLREFSDGARPDESMIYSRPQGEDLWLDIYHPPQRAARRAEPRDHFRPWRGFLSGKPVAGGGKPALVRRSWLDGHQHRLPVGASRPADVEPCNPRCRVRYGRTARNAAALRIDLNRVALTGGSAGATLAMSAGYLANAKQSDPECGVVPRVAVVIAKVPLIDVIEAWYHGSELLDEQRSYLARYIGGSPQDFPERYAAVDVRRFQFPSNPPTLIVGGVRPLLPPEIATDFMRKANAAGLEVHQILFPYSGHDFNTTYYSLTNQAMRQIVAQFIIDHKAGPEFARSLAD